MPYIPNSDILIIPDFKLTFLNYVILTSFHHHWASQRWPSSIKRITLELWQQMPSFFFYCSWYCRLLQLTDRLHKFVGLHASTTPESHQWLENVFHPSCRERELRGGDRNSIGGWRHFGSGYSCRPIPQCHRHQVQNRKWSLEGRQNVWFQHFPPRWTLAWVHQVYC